MAEAADAVTGVLRELRDRFAPLDEGQLADYIPELTRADPDAFGLALISMEGHCYTSGRTRVPFTLQSVSKPFVYALALAELGLDEVCRWVNAEPSGEAYNAISLEPVTGRPDNAMVNAGAIVTTALVPDTAQAPRFDRIMECLSRFAGRTLDVDEDVCASESATGDRNRALAYLMRSAGSLPGHPIDTVETYFRQCAVRATAVDLAVMAATLANGGVNPLTGDRVVPEPVAVQVLSVMATCGMYDASGDWLLRVGLPAKSGVSGGLIAAGPARFGLAAYSPLLDPGGTSVRGLAALRALSQQLGLHLMHNPAVVAPTVTLAAPAGEHPHRVSVVAAQGAIDFTGAERVLYALDRAAPEPSGPTVLDLRRVTGADAGAVALLRDGLGRRAAHGCRLAVVVRSGLLGRFDEDSPWLRRFEGREEAVAWAAAQS